jgi:hypothetical protein
MKLMVALAPKSKSLSAMIDIAAVVDLLANLARMSVAFFAQLRCLLARRCSVERGELNITANTRQLLTQP